MVYSQTSFAYPYAPHHNQSHCNIATASFAYNPDYFSTIHQAARLPATGEIPAGGSIRSQWTFFHSEGIAPVKCMEKLRAARSVAW